MAPAAGPKVGQTENLFVAGGGATLDVTSLANSEKARLTALSKAQQMAENSQNGEKAVSFQAAVDRSCTEEVQQELKQQDFPFTDMLAVLEQPHFLCR